MSTNSEIRNAGLHHTKNFFVSQGYQVIDGNFIGYDYEIRKNDNSFFILVKSTEKNNLSQRWLEKSQDDLRKKYPTKFLLVLVKNSPEEPFIYGIYSGKLLENKTGRLVYHQYFDLSEPVMFDLQSLD